MARPKSRVFATYSERADAYDERANAESCWGVDTEKIIRSITLKPGYCTVVDVGCGTGDALAYLASAAKADRQFIGIEPAANMRQRAIERTRHLSSVTIKEGAFENLPVESASVDYMFSINALHWSPDLGLAMCEMARVMKPSGEMDHYFIGRDIGREFILKTSPVFLKYLGPKRFLEAATLRQNLTRDEALKLFSDTFGSARVTLDERYDTYYDTIEGHLGWWVRIEPQLLGIPADLRDDCDREVRRALATLETDQGIPYTKHTLHAKVRQS